METNEFLNVLNKMKFQTIGGGATGGKINYANPNDRNTIVSLRLHPMDRRVLDWQIRKEGRDVMNGTSAKELLRALQDEGTGKFSRVSKSFSGLAFNEDLEQYDNKIEVAISHIFKINEEAAKTLVQRMSFKEYLDLAIALDKDDTQLAEQILQKYGYKGTTQSTDPSPTPESIAQHINYLSNNNEDNIVTPELRQLKEFDLREVLNILQAPQIQKILANFRGYAEPGMYESSLFTAQLVEEIILKFKSLRFDEVVPNAPNKPNGANSDERLERDSEVAISNPAGETEDGTVIADTGNMVTVQTKTGRKTVKKDTVMKPVVDENTLKELAQAFFDDDVKADAFSEKAVDENALDIKRFKQLAGIKTEPIQTEEEEIEITEDESLGTSFSLEIDGEKIKTSDDSEDLRSYANEHGAGKEWTIYDEETGAVAADYEGEGYLQDASKSSEFRSGKPMGWEGDEERLRNPGPETKDDYTELHFEEEPLLTDEEAKKVANKVLWKIGETWPDLDPSEMALQVISKYLGMRTSNDDPYTGLMSTERGEKAFNQVRNTFIELHGGDFEDHFDELTKSMQGSNPIHDYDVPHLGRSE